MCESRECIVETISGLGLGVTVRTQEGEEDTNLLL